MKTLFAIFGILAALWAPSALAWGAMGHEVTALIAYHHMSPSGRQRLDALLASDPDTLTAPDFASRTDWADRYRTGHRQTDHQGRLRQFVRQRRSRNRQHGGRA